MQREQGQALERHPDGQLVSASCGALRVELEPEPDRTSAGVVALLNTGETPLRVFRAGNSWGDDALSFEVSDGVRIVQITRVPQVYTRNVPSTAEIAPAERHLLPYDLADGGWTGGTELIVAGSALTAIYVVEESPEASEQGAWTGRCASAAVTL
jgi:hypothetical protein